MAVDKNEQLKTMPIKKDIWDVVDFINMIFNTAVDMKASDIHIEPTEHFIIIRFRIDGDFIIFDKIDREHISVIATRLKVLSKIKIDENKKPQDGKIVFFYDKEKKNIDLRLSTLPTSYGEKVVMRILKPDTSLTNIQKLWFIETNLAKVAQALESSYGIILVAGPTGSWKSTTLFGVLKNFNPLEYNISTLEDPIEYDIPFVNQSQVRPDIGYTFATGLRTLVRQDPDIIMVWEIRDKETAVLAVEAALTGHLVLSTIHTNSATATIQRLINMWVESFLLASAIKMVISQRLVKRICQNCKQATEVKPHMKEKVTNYLKWIVDESQINSMVFYKWVWCEKCNQSGYKWRLWIHEVLIVEDYLEPMIMTQKTANEMNVEAIQHGMITIVQDAIIKAALWDTTLDEAFTLI